MERNFIEQLYRAHQHAAPIPSPTEVCKVLNGFLQLLFPELGDRRFDSLREFEQYYYGVRLQLNQILCMLGERLNGSPEDIENAIMERLPHVKELLMTDARSIEKGDPAAESITEVIRTYPGFYAMAVYRLAHEMYQLQIPLIPRILSEHAHTRTGIEIHPAAEIGTGFCIDHGTGIVIGETAEIGNDVKMYQGVTLGALSVKKEMAK
ncbi:MAG: serine acetyltransferase, partial [Bacteroidota bacterium]